MLGSDGTPRKNPERPDWFDKWRALNNFTNVFVEQDITIIADGVDDQVWNQLNTLYPNLDLQRTTFGHNAGSFLYSLEQALLLPDTTQVYFVEDDYIHHEGADLILKQGLDRAAYVSLYDHPDKYWQQQANNPCILMQTESCHWRTTPSTTMTFAAYVYQLKNDRDIFYRWCGGDDHWTHDSQLFTELTQKSRLITPVPGYATHCDNWTMDKIIDWQDVLTRTTQETTTMSKLLELHDHGARLFNLTNTDETYTDKGTRHTYIDFYSENFKNMSEVKLMEIGVRSGGSLWLWKNYFPKYELWGIDIAGGYYNNRPFVPELNSDPNIHVTWNVSSYDPESYVNIPKDLDVIIEDGDHSIEAQYKTILCAWHTLKSGGMYIIEDVANIETANRLTAMIQDQISDIKSIETFTFDLIKATDDIIIKIVKS